MKAVQMSSYGSPEVLQVTSNAQKPTSGSGQILVEVRAAGINPFEGKLRQGYMKAMIPQTFPFTMGGDFAGLVIDVGEGVTEYKKGDEVYGSAMALGSGSGALAEFAAVKTGSVASKPKNLNFTDAASLPLVGSSSVQALIEHINLQKGQKILIHGGAGGIGTIAIQIAKALGAFVATTVSAKDVDFVKHLGADVVIDFKTEKFESKLSGYDAVYDTVGGGVTDTSFPVLKKGGILVSMNGKPNETLAAKYGVTAVGQGTKTNTAHLTTLREFVENGKVKPQVAKVFPMRDVARAFRFMETGHPQGKVVVTVP